MPRFYQSKDKHTKPELAGEQNMPEDYAEKNKQDGADELLTNLIPIFDEGMKKRTRGSAWTAEELIPEITNYFQYCANKSLKPSKSGLRLWLGCSRSQYHAWQSEMAKYGEISDIINHANDVMETQYISRGEKYPTMNMFLLKSSYGHAETQNVNITGSTNAEDVAEAIKKLGLDKTE